MAGDEDPVPEASGSVSVNVEKLDPDVGERGNLTAIRLAVDNQPADDHLDTDLLSTMLQLEEVPIADLELTFDPERQSEQTDISNLRISRGLESSNDSVNEVATVTTVGSGSSHGGNRLVEAD